MNKSKENLKVNIENLTQTQKEELHILLSPIFSVVASLGDLECGDSIYIYPKSDCVTHSIEGVSDGYFESHKNKEISIEELMYILKSGFTKSRLEVGKHVVELEDGDQFLLIETNTTEVAGVALNGSSHYPRILNYFNNDLTDVDNPTHGSIVKVYKINNSSIFGRLDNKLKLVWERETKSQAQIQYEECEKKMQELQEKMGKLKQQM